MSSQIIENVRPRGFTLTMRDKNGEPRTIELPGTGPWEVDFESGTVTNERPVVAAPPDDEITLRIRCTNTDKVVRVYATGSGATAWADKQGKLLGVAWTRDEHGAPHVVLDKSRTLLGDIRKALPKVRVDTTECHDINVNPAAVGGVRAAGDTKRGERMAVHDVGVSTAAAATRTKPVEPPPPAAPSERASAPTAATEIQRESSLQWAATDNNGRPGFVAQSKKGTYKALHVAGKTFGLFYEHDGGGLDMITCGSLEEVKAAAEAEMKGMPGEQVLAGVCGEPAKAPCPSPRGRKIFTVDELLLRYTMAAAGHGDHESNVRTAFEGAIKDGMSLCADLDGKQDWKDLNVDQALVLLKERGDSGPSAVYAVAEQAPRARTTRSPERKTARADRPPPPASEQQVDHAATPASPGARSEPPEPERPATGSTGPEPATGTDEELLKSFSAELESVLGEEDD